MNGPARPGKDYPLTEYRREIAVFLLLCFVRYVSIQQSYSPGKTNNVQILRCVPVTCKKVVDSRFGWRADRSAVGVCFLMYKFIKIPLRQLSLDHGLRSSCRPKPDYGPAEVQRSGLMNGIKIAAAKPLGAQLGACTIMYQAGSRYEINNEIGASHFLRAASSASGCSYSKFMKGRMLSQYGAALTCTNNRQSIAFTLRCPIHLFSDLKSYLLDTAVRGLYRNWEITDLKSLIWDDLHRIHPEQRAIDLVQRACWGGPLSNSVFCEYERIGHITGDILAEFVRENFKTDHCCVSSVGVPFEETMKLAEIIDSKRVKPQPRSEMYCFPRRGYEVYDLGPDSTTWIAIVVPGCGAGDLRCLLMHAIIAAACGTGNLQMGQHSMDRVPQTPLGCMSGEDAYTDYRAFNISYWDTGVFGIIAKTRACTACNVALKVAEFLSCICDLNCNQIHIGKQRLKLSLALNDEDCVKLSEGLALQLANGTPIDNTADAMTMIDNINLDEISTTARILSAKKSDMAVAVVGDVSCVPHDRELIRW